MNFISDVYYYIYGDLQDFSHYFFSGVAVNISLYFVAGVRGVYTVIFKKTTSEYIYLLTQVRSMELEADVDLQLVAPELIF